MMLSALDAIRAWYAEHGDEEIRMPAKPEERQYRMMAMPFHTVGESGEKRFDTPYYAEGYATTFDDPYTLKTYSDGWRYVEVVDPGCLEGADMSDVLFQYNHAGFVYARNRNNTLIIEPDGHGLFTATDLSHTTHSREIHEDIAAGMVSAMSWGFTIAEQEVTEDPATKTITARIKRIGKVYDVSVVSLPADPNTEISARSLIDGEIEAARVRESERRAVKRMRELVATRARALEIGFKE